MNLPRLHSFLLFVCIVALAACNPVLKRPPFDAGTRPDPKAPDYAQLSAWAAHPLKSSPAKLVPAGSGWQPTQDTSVAVFYIYPTGYTGKTWNLDLERPGFTATMIRLMLRHQAAAYNGAGPVYAPFYRQATLFAYDDTTASRRYAFDLAYSDVLRAFVYFVKNQLGNRPFILAAHSQGSGHGLRLLNEKIAGTPLQERMVAAYLVGLPSRQHDFTMPKISYCCDSVQTGCWLTYHAYATDVRRLRGYVDQNEVNPLSWKCDTLPVPGTQNPGSVDIYHRLRRKAGFGARIMADGGVHVLRKPGPAFPAWGNGSDMHVMDYGIYHASLRQNAQRRAQKWLELYGGK